MNTVYKIGKRINKRKLQSSPCSEGQCHTLNSEGQCYTLDTEGQCYTLGYSGRQFAARKARQGKKRGERRRTLAVFLVIVAVVCVLVGYKSSVDITTFLPDYQRVYYTQEGETLNNTPTEYIAEAVKFSPAYVDGLLSGLGARIVFEEWVEGIHIIYAYTPLLSAPVQLSFGRVNLMIAVSHTATAASPLIYGSY